MESQIQLNEERLKLLDKFKQALPNLMVPEYAKSEIVYRDGALSNKIKRLIALGIAQYLHGKSKINSLISTQQLFRQ